MGNVLGMGNTENHTTEAAIYTIALSNLDTIEKRIASANKRAAKIGQTGYTITTSPAAPLPVYPEVEDGYIFAGPKPEPLYYVEQVQITITGLIPKLGDWDVIATLTNDPHAGVVSATFPGVDVDLSTIRIDSTDCDHCKTNRQRKTTYVLRDQAGNLIRVGKTCLTLFTGVLVSPFESFPRKIDAELQEMIGMYGSGDSAFSTSQIIRLAVGAVTRHGFVSSTAARDDYTLTSTAERVRCALGRSTSDQAARAAFLASADPTRVTAIIDYARSLPADPTSEYMTNLIACCTPDLVSWKNIGIVVSVVSNYDRHIARLAKEAAQAGSTHYGTVGIRVKAVPVKVIENRYIPGYRGDSTHLVKLVTDTGAILVWMTRFCSLEVGQQLTADFRIKEHAEFRGTRETKISNVTQI